MRSQPEPPLSVLCTACIDSAEMAASNSNHKSHPAMPLESLVTREQIAEIKEVFDFFDRDASGSISATELGEAARLMGQNLTPEEEADILAVSL